MGPELIAKGKTRMISASFTRPNDTTTYAAGDVVSTLAGAIMTFSGAVIDGEGAIQQAILLDSANVTALKMDAELWLFDTAPAATADNSAIAFTDAELARLIGVIPFYVGEWKVGLATSGAGGNAVNVQSGLGVPIYTRTTATPVNDIYGVLVTRNAYVPVAQEIFTVTLGMMY